MIKPKFITFTGIDERTDLARMEDLSSRYPIEWGILFSKANSGRVNRYPGPDVIAKFLSSPKLGKELKFSAHICGQWSRLIMEHGVHEEMLVDFIRKGFERTQINVADGETRVQGDIRPQRAAEWAEAIKAKRAIIQCRGAFPDNSMVDWLFDCSGGAGIQPKSWDAKASMLTSGVFPGYAGGMGPNNIQTTLEEISIVHPAGMSFWIDMEGNIRDYSDWLDLDKCEAVARTVYGE